MNFWIHSVVLYVDYIQRGAGKCLIAVFLGRGWEWGWEALLIAFTNFCGKNIPAMAYLNFQWC